MRESEREKKEDTERKLFFSRNNSLFNKITWKSIVGNKDMFSLKINLQISDFQARYKAMESAEQDLKGSRTRHGIL